MAYKKKYVLCCPEGGLNDMLCRISICYRYCLATGRILLIDTRKVGFREVLEHYLVSASDRVRIVVTQEDIPQTIYYYPRIGRHIQDYSAGYTEAGYKDTASGILLKFDFDKDYDEEILLYHDCGGGIGSHEVFDYLRFSPQILQKIATYSSKIPRPYTAIHLRGTDGFETDYDDLFRYVAEISCTNLFVASESKYVLNEGHRRLGMHNIYTFRDFTRADFPVHMYNRDIPLTHDRSTINAQTFIDLGALALSDNFLALEKFYSKRWISGYNKLAYFLHLNRARILS